MRILRFSLSLSELHRFYYAITILFSEKVKCSEFPSLLHTLLQSEENIAITNNNNNNKLVMCLPTKVPFFLAFCSNIQSIWNVKKYGALWLSLQWKTRRINCQVSQFLIWSPRSLHDVDFTVFQSHTSAHSDWLCGVQGAINCRSTTAWLDLWLGGAACLVDQGSPAGPWWKSVERAQNKT